jgi:hypothetical protein
LHQPGLVDWPAVQKRLREQGIVLVGGGADEAPEVYKRLPEVLAAHGNSIRVKHTSPARRRDGRTRRARPVQGLRAARAALSRSSPPSLGQVKRAALFLIVICHCAVGRKVVAQ